MSDLTRRNIGEGLAALATLIASGGLVSPLAAQTNEPPKAADTGHDMHSMPAHWMGSVSYTHLDVYKRQCWP